ncbi:hypothetical protein B0H11DRAFT_2257575 [Mycena galericulata]|nr:hypothetical protein B0H11DRAFT_2257575 [Mycena galericulata]
MSPIEQLKIEEHGELLSSLLLSAAETGDENWEPIVPIAVYLREHIRPALFILEACCWAPGRHGERYQITPGEEALIRSWLHAIRESLVTVAMARYRAHATRGRTPLNRGRTGERDYTSVASAPKRARIDAADSLPTSSTLNTLSGKESAALHERQIRRWNALWFCLLCSSMMQYILIWTAQILLP